MIVSPRHLRQLLWSLAGLLVALGVLAWLWPATGATDPPPPFTAAPQPAAMSDAENAATSAEDMVLTNVFAVNRRAPATRYSPPELAGDSANGAMAAPAPMPAMPFDSLTLAGDVPRLYGTVIDAQGARALLHLSDRGLRLYDVGARDGGYTVVSIAPREVVVRGPGGRVTLRLDPQEDRR